MKHKIYAVFAVVLLLCVFGWTTFAQKQPPSKSTWEYMNMTLPDYEGSDRLNNAGAGGWELVAVTQLAGPNTTKTYYFKRMK